MNVSSLEEALSRPTPALATTLGALDGDLVVLGAGGKMGPSLCRMARRALEAAGADRKVFAVSRFSDPALPDALRADGVVPVACDLLDREGVAALPAAAAVVYMAGMKFGTAAAPSRTWALNALVPAIVGERYAGVPTVMFSSGNVYPMVPVDAPVTEATPPAPVGEYAWSVLARERVFDHCVETLGTPVVHYRLNYAAELRYGVPLDIARDVLAGRPVDLSMGWFNALWQGDANAFALRALELASTPAAILNVTGPECLAVEAVARRFGELLDREPTFTGTPAPTALLSDATRSFELFGPPTVTADELFLWIAAWLRDGGPTHGKPTNFAVRDGGF